MTEVVAPLVLEGNECALNRRHVGFAPVTQTMKTMLELLTRLVEMRNCYEQAQHNSQLAESERAAACCLKSLVRDCLPSCVLATYDQMKKAEPELLDCPEVFAMAVLVSTYRSLPAVSRENLLTHFNSPSPPEGKIQDRQCKHRHLRRPMGAAHRSRVPLR